MEIVSHLFLFNIYIFNFNGQIESITEHCLTSSLLMKTILRITSCFYYLVYFLRYNPRERLTGLGCIFQRFFYICAGGFPQRLRFEVLSLTSTSAPQPMEMSAHPQGACASHGANTKHDYFLKSLPIRWAAKILVLKYISLICKSERILCVLAIWMCF